MSIHTRRRSFAKMVLLLLALMTAVPLATSTADARAGGGFSSGSRGSRSFSAPGFTRTAPSGGAAFQRSEAQQPGFGGNVAAPRRFGFGSGLAMGLLGAGLFGLFGHGLFGLLPLLLIGGVVLIVLRNLGQRRGAVAGGPAPRAGFAPAAGFQQGGPATGPRSRPGSTPITVAPADFDAFESALVDVETAYGREDMTALSRLATPEMLRNFDHDLRDNRARGVHNDVGDARLLQGDLAEAWREGATDYATVAMRFSLRDLTVERASGRILSGDPARASEATELWTFRRDNRGPWLLSAIQQTA